MKLPVIAVSVFLLTQQSPPPPPKATIEGVVVRIGTGEPIEGAQVIATRQNPGGAGALSGVVSPAPPPLPPVPQAGAGGTFAGTTTFSFSSVAGAPLNVPGAVPPVTTDGGGKFAIKDLDPGAYRIAIAANGFTRQEYGQRVFPGQGTAVVLVAGQTLNNVVIRMAPSPFAACLRAITKFFPGKLSSPMPSTIPRSSSSSNRKVSRCACPNLPKRVSKCVLFPLKVCNRLERKGSSP